MDSCVVTKDLQTTIEMRTYAIVLAARQEQCKVAAVSVSDVAQIASAAAVEMDTQRLVARELALRRVASGIIIRIPGLRHAAIAYGAARRIIYI